MLSPTRGQITHVLLTRAPLYWGRSPFSLDLHVLGAPLTFVLSQDQTLQLNPALYEVPSDSLFRSICASSPSTEDPGSAISRVNRAVRSSRVTNHCVIHHTAA